MWWFLTFTGVPAVAQPCLIACGHAKSLCSHVEFFRDMRVRWRVLAEWKKRGALGVVPKNQRPIPHLHYYFIFIYTMHYY